MGANVKEQANLIEGKMKGLMRELAKLAPHPSKPIQGPAFAKIDSEHKPASEHDSMLGSMVMESILGTAFASAIGETLGEVAAQLDWSNAAEAVSEYRAERTSAKPSYGLGQKRAITSMFNISSDKDRLMQAYLSDLPKRMGLERWLAHYQRKLHALRKASLGREFAPGY